MIIRSQLTTVAIAVVMCFAQSAGAAGYKCVFGNGVVSYQNEPCGKAPAPSSAQYDRNGVAINSSNGAVVSANPSLPQTPRQNTVGQKEAAARDRKFNSFNAVVLDRMYAENELAVDEILKGKPVRVAGTVKSVSKDMFGNLLINFEVDNQFMNATMNMERSEAGKMAAIRAGQSVTVQCVSMRRIVGSPYGKGCTIIE